MAQRVSIVLVAILLVWTPSALALPDWSFSLLPATGEISGVPGETIGWGYSITNPDPLTWLSLSGISADPFANGTATSLFDFPTLAPGDSVVVPFVADTLGLFQLTWDLAAPVGTINTGSFLLTADWYDGDPFVGGQYLDAAIPITADYVATVTAPPAAVPEPPTFLLISMAILGFWVCRRTV